MTVSIFIHTFHRYIVEGYSEDIGSRFLRQVDPATEISYPDAMDALDRALLEGSKSLPPSLDHRTTSAPSTLTIPEEIRRLVHATKA